MNAMNLMGRLLTRILERPLPGYEPATPPDFGQLQAVLQPGDVILVEGDTRIASVIKYLTQSTWSHSAIYVGDVLGRFEADGEPHVLVEAELNGGVLTSPLSKYKTAHVRICRPVALTREDAERVSAFVIDRIGYQYDVKNVLDLARYLIPMPIPARFRRRMIALGSGDPTRAICSTLIAEAFQSVGYPILPRVRHHQGESRATSRFAREEILRIRHHSLYAPRDFDLSPYFSVVKPTIEHGFDYKRIVWQQEAEIETASARGQRPRRLLSGFAW